jgi:DNA-binding NtrC family response regulator
MLKVKILIVDDEEDYCMIMKNYFEEKDYEVYLAYNLKDGLRLIKEKHPDILFLDNNLPDGEGWHHTNEIVRENPGIKINLISAYKQRTREFDSFSNLRIWEKPISMQSLEEVFRS